MLSASSMSSVSSVVHSSRAGGGRAAGTPLRPLRPLRFDQPTMARRRRFADAQRPAYLCFQTSSFATTSATAILGIRS